MHGDQIRSRAGQQGRHRGRQERRQHSHEGSRTKALSVSAAAQSPVQELPEGREERPGLQVLRALEKKKSYIGAVGGGGPQERQKVIKLNSFLFFFCMCVYFCERVYTCTYRGQSSTPGCLPQSLSTFNTYIFLKTLFLFYVWGGFNHICICVHHACPVCLEARREC